MTQISSCCYIKPVCHVLGLMSLRYAVQLEAYLRTGVWVEMLIHPEIEIYSLPALGAMVSVSAQLQPPRQPCWIPTSHTTDVLSLSTREGRYTNILSSRSYCSISVVFFPKSHRQNHAFNSDRRWGAGLLPLCTFAILSIYIDDLQCNVPFSRRENIWSINICSKTSAVKEWFTKMQISQQLRFAPTGPPSLSHNMPKCMTRNLPVKSCTLLICWCWCSPWAKHAGVDRL